MEILTLLLVALAFYVWGFSSAVNRVSRLSIKSMKQKDQMLTLAQAKLVDEDIDPLKVMGLVLVFMGKPSNLYNADDLEQFKTELNNIERVKANGRKTARPNRRSSKASV